MLPAWEFSTGTTPRSARPASTASKTPAHVAHGTVSTSPNRQNTASSLYAPGSP